jgi:hypothetical protein
LLYFFNFCWAFQKFLFFCFFFLCHLVFAHAYTKWYLLLAAWCKVTKDAAWSVVLSSSMGLCSVGWTAAVAAQWAITTSTL